jgi:hypothetical protein
VDEREHELLLPDCAIREAREFAAPDGNSLVFVDAFAVSGHCHEPSQNRDLTKSEFRLMMLSRSSTTPPSTPDRHGIPRPYSHSIVLEHGTALIQQGEVFHPR